MFLSSPGSVGGLQRPPGDLRTHSWLFWSAAQQTGLDSRPLLSSTLLRAVRHRSAFRDRGPFAGDMGRDSATQPIGIQCSDFRRF